MSKLVSIASLALLSLAACEGQPDGNTEGSAPAAAESDLSAASTCEQNELFVKQGLAQDMRDTLGSTDDHVRVPGVLVAYESFQGDMIQTVPAASANAERVFDENPGGPFSGQLGGSAANADKFQQTGLTAAVTLFDAMTAAAETSWTADGLTETVRTSKAGRFSCRVRKVDTAVRNASCSFTDLLMLRAVSWPKSSEKCVK